MSRYPLHGGCHCGRVRYTLRASPLSVQHCHCSQCRKGFATLSAQGAVVRRRDLEIEGSEALTTYYTSASFSYRFCATCGSRLFASDDSEAELMYLMPATLDGGVHPGHPADKEAHTFVASRAEWDHFGEGLPRYEAECPDEIVSDLMRSGGTSPE